METKFGLIQAVKEVISQFPKPGTKSVMISQELVRTYPVVRNNTDGIISDSEMGEGQKFPSKRNMIVNIPDSMSVEQFQERLDKFPQARIRRTLSLKPILSEGQKWAIKEGKATEEQIAARQAAQSVDPVTQEVTSILRDGQQLYRSLSLSSSGEEDVDLTTRF